MLGLKKKQVPMRLLVCFFILFFSFWHVYDSYFLYVTGTGLMSMVPEHANEGWPKVPVNEE